VHSYGSSRKQSSWNITETEPSIAGAQEDTRVDFHDSVDGLDALESFSQDEDQPVSENSGELSVPRHSSLMVKLGFLMHKKSLNAPLARRWCSLNVFKFEIFSRDQSNVLSSLLMATLERVEICFDSQGPSNFPMKLHQKRKYRSIPIELISPSAAERQEWVTVTPPIKLLMAFSITHATSSETLTSCTGFQRNINLLSQSARLSFGARKILARVSSQHALLLPPFTTGMFTLAFFSIFTQVRLELQPRRR
jgi:hypothetical protein